MTAKWLRATKTRCDVTKIRYVSHSNYTDKHWHQHDIIWRFKFTQQHCVLVTSHDKINSRSQRLAEGGRHWLVHWATNTAAVDSTQPSDPHQYSHSLSSHSLAYWTEIHPTAPYSVSPTLSCRHWVALDRHWVTCFTHEPPSTAQWEPLWYVWVCVTVWHELVSYWNLYDCPTTLHALHKLLSYNDITN